MHEMGGGKLTTDQRQNRSLHGIVVRIEVHDTGVGIKPRDMIDNRVSVGDCTQFRDILSVIL